MNVIILLRYCLFSCMSGTRLKIAVTLLEDKIVFRNRICEPDFYNVFYMILCLFSLSIVCWPILMLKLIILVMLY